MTTETQRYAVVIDGLDDDAVNGSGCGNRAQHRPRQLPESLSCKVLRHSAAWRLYSFLQAVSSGFMTARTLSCRMVFGDETALTRRRARSAWRAFEQGMGYQWIDCNRSFDKGGL